MERDDTLRRCPVIGRVLVGDATKLTGHHLGWKQFSCSAVLRVCSRSVAESARIAIFSAVTVSAYAAVEDTYLDLTQQRPGRPTFAPLRARSVGCSGQCVVSVLGQQGWPEDRRWKRPIEAVQHGATDSRIRAFDRLRPTGERENRPRFTEVGVDRLRSPVASHARGQRFESSSAHHLTHFSTIVSTFSCRRLRSTDRRLVAVWWQFLLYRTSKMVSDLKLTREAFRPSVCRSWRR
jgi:hypothetical protein